MFLMSRSLIFASSVFFVDAVVRNSKIAYAVDAGGQLSAILEEQEINFDCRAGHSRWQKGWSDQKKDYCCTHHRKGCSITEAVRVAEASVKAGTKSVSGVIARAGHSFRMADPRLSVPSVAHQLASASLATNATTDLPPGFVFLGRGYDVFQGNPITTLSTGDPGWRFAIFDFSYTNGQTTSDGKYAIPDQVQGTRYTTCDYDLHGHQINSLYAYQKTIKDGFSLGGGYDGAEFSLGIEATHVRDATVNDKKIYMTSAMACVSYQLTLNPFLPPALSTTFLDAVNKYLPSTYDSASYGYFIEQFGTSFVTQMKLGGRWGSMYTFDYSSFADLLQDAIDVSANVGWMSYVKAGFNYSKNTTDTEKVESSIVRGDAFNIGGDFSTDPKTWAEKVAQNPMPVHQSLMPIYSLLGPPYWSKPSAEVQTKQSLLETAVKDYCTNLGQKLGISDACAPPPYVAPLAAVAPPRDAVHQICISNVDGLFRAWCRVWLSGPGVDASNPPSTETAGFDYGYNQCVPGSALGAQNGQVFNCECTAEVGRTVGCGGTYPFWATSSLNGQYACGGTTLSIHCHTAGTSNEDGPLR